MNIQKTTKIALLTALIAITGAQCWGAAQNNSDWLLVREIRESEDNAKKVKQLIDRGGNVDESADDFEPIIFTAVRRSKNRTLKALLNAGADVNATNPHGETPLTVAVQTNNPDAVEALLEAGADINFADRNNKTALWLAISNLKYGYSDRSNAIFRRIIQLLVQHGADIGDLGPTLEAMGIEVRGG